MPFCHMIRLGIYSNVMLRFMVQALQEPPLCSRTLKLARREDRAGDHEQLISNGRR
jgi:hypothetical protein